MIKFLSEQKKSNHEHLIPKRIDSKLRVPCPSILSERKPKLDKSDLSVNEKSNVVKRVRFEDDIDITVKDDITIDSRSKVKVTPEMS